MRSTCPPRGAETLALSRAAPHNAQLRIIRLIYAVHRITRSSERSGFAAASSSSRSRPRTVPPTSLSGNRATSERQRPAADPCGGAFLRHHPFRCRTDPCSPFPVQKPSRRISDHPMPARVGSRRPRCPQFLPRGMSAPSAPVMIRTRQNRHPRAPLRGAYGVLTARSSMAPTSRLLRRKENTMIALYDHIQQLRAELRGCCFTRRERAGAGEGDHRSGQARPRIRRRPGGAVESHRGDRGRRVSGPSSAALGGPNIRDLHATRHLVPTQFAQALECPA